MQRVTSRHNPRLREAARLIASARDRRKANRCVLEGEHLVAVYRARYGSPETLIVTDDALARDAVRGLVAENEARTLVVPASIFAELATLPADVGVLAVVPTPQPRTSAPADFCLLLEDVQDPGNVGSMLRSAAAAGVAQVLLSEHCAFAWSPKVLRASQGAHFLLDIHENVDLAAWAAAYRASRGVVIATVAAGGENLYVTTLTGRVAMVIGNEGTGVTPGLAATADRRVSIPMPGAMESLNAAAAAAVCLFECVRQREAARALAAAKPGRGAVR
jgi:TrmH family RNA methyltransferase